MQNLKLGLMCLLISAISVIPAPNAFGSMLCNDFFQYANSSGSTAFQGTILDIDFPKMTYSLKSEIESGAINADTAFFILLPGNMGSHWQNTNHNIGYDMLIDLLRAYGGVGRTDGKQDYNSPLEKVTFNTRELGDNVDFLDSQVFYSQSGYARTSSGEMFVSKGEPGKPTLVFMRRYGFYNDVGNFFVPTIHELGGRSENIIVVHDDLRSPLGSLNIELGNATYNGNRAILSVHNNLNALRLNKKLNEVKLDLIKLFLGDINSQPHIHGLEIDTLMWSIEKMTWQAVVDIKNQANHIQFKSLLIRTLRESTLSYVQSAVNALELLIAKPLEALNAAKMEIKTAQDKELAVQNYKNIQQNFLKSNSLAQDYFTFKEMLADIKSKKSKLLDRVYKLYAADFDPRLMASPFSRIGIGTGYEEWAEQGRREGFPPLPEGIEHSDLGGYPHFVLSPRESKTFNKELSLKVISKLNEIIQNIPGL